MGWDHPSRKRKRPHFKGFRRLRLIFPYEFAMIFTKSEF